MTTLEETEYIAFSQNGGGKDNIFLQLESSQSLSSQIILNYLVSQSACGCSLRSRRLEIVGVSLARARSLFRPLPPSERLLRRLVLLRTSWQ